MKTALIFGVSGQDGAYLARLLLAHGYTVHGTSRDAAGEPFARLHALGIRERVVTHTLSMTDPAALRQCLGAIAPDEIYNLAGLSSVASSFAEPELAHDSIAGAQLRLLDAVRELGSSTRVYFSASSECFGDLPHGTAADEATPFAPRSPYASAKAEGHRMTVRYREEQGLYAVSGILCNHESPLRGDAFVTKKIMTAATAVAEGRFQGRLTLGDLSVSRDWGYAAEYVEAMWLMLQQEQPADFVIATGESHTVEELAEAVFAEVGLDYREHISVDRSLLRPSDIHYSRGNPTKAAQSLGWTARTKVAELVRLLTAQPVRV
jgi:GDPmannose 4,6-dehydratase